MFISKSSIILLLAKFSSLAIYSEASCTAPSRVVCKKVVTPPTLDGDLSDWDDIDEVTSPIVGAKTEIAYAGGDMSIKCSFDDEMIYFAISVPGKYRFDSTDDHKCAAISTMMKVGEDAVYYDMGACPEASAGCPNGIPDVCKSYLVDVGAHWELKTTSQGELYASDVSTETGNDPIANKDDEYAVSAYCRFDDEGTGSGNEWSGAWVHNVDTSKPTEYTSVDGTDGTYVFEMSRSLTTTSTDTDAQLAENNSYGFGLAYWDPNELESVGWTAQGHYVTGCAQDWMELVLGTVEEPTSPPTKSASSNLHSGSIFSRMSITFATTMVIGWFVMM